MAHIAADRVMDTTTTTGTGSLTLSGTAVPGFRTFASVMATSDTCFYCISRGNTIEWEVGLGTLTAATTLARTTVLSSSNANAAVNFAAGTKDVFITAPVYQSGALADWTTTWTQTATITHTTLRNKWIKVNGIIHCWGYVEATSAGTASAEIVMTVPETAAYAGSSTVGSWNLYDSSVPRNYNGSVLMVSTTTIRFSEGDSTSGLLGTAPAVTIDTGDQLGFYISYPAATP